MTVLTRKPMKCQNITNAPLRNLASCVTSTGTHAVLSNWLTVPPSFIAFYAELTVASSQGRTPGEKLQNLMQRKRREGRAPTVIPGICLC